MSTSKDKLGYLVRGYVIKEIKAIGLEEVYPFELNLFIMQFLGNIFIKFDLVNEKYRDCIKNDGTLIVRDNEAMNLRYESFSILSSNAFSSGDIHEFSIKCNKSMQDSIGIMSNTKITAEDDCYHASAKAQFYYYYLYGGMWETKKNLLGNSGCQRIFEDEEIKHVQENDIVTVEVNCVEWTLKFMLNDELMGGIINIEPQAKYHPFIGLYQCDAEYELLL